MTVTTSTNLPTTVPNNCYRFFGKAVTTRTAPGYIVVDIDGDEFTVKETTVRLGYVNGKQCIDVRDYVAEQIGLV